MGSGNVQITIADGGVGAVVVPGASVLVVIGCSQQGTVNAIVATRSPTTIVNTFGYGPMPEAAAIAALAGGTVLCMRVPTATPGSATAVTHTGTGTSVVTVTGTPLDDYFAELLVQAGGTIGTTGITFQLSLDAGRSFGPLIALGTATTYVIPNTGLTLNFAAGTMVAADTYTFSTLGPAWNTAGIQAALLALQASPYAGSGFGGIHIVSNQLGVSGANATTIEGYLDTLATGFIFSRAFLSSRDAVRPTSWGGAGETESTWMTSIGTDYGAVSAKRLCVGAGYYNMPSAFPNPAAGTWKGRRPLTWAAAARHVTIPRQRHMGRVKDGALGTIVTNPLTDPQDGFVYHDERINPGLDYLEAGFGVNRFMAAWTRIPNLPGWFITNPLLMSPQGSDFFMLPLGNVMDDACSITQQVGQQQINDDVRTNPSGTIYGNDALAIQSAIKGAIDANMTNKKEISFCSVTVDTTANVQATSNVPITVSIGARGYILSESIQIGFQSTAAAQPGAS